MARLKVLGPNYQKKQAHRRAAHRQKLLVHQYKLGRGLTLTVPRPFDDGGSTIKGLVLRFRHHDSENFPGAWRHVGSFATKDWPLQLDVTNELLTSREDSHNHSYEFSVAPYNRLVCCSLVRSYGALRDEQ